MHRCDGRFYWTRIIRPCECIYLPKAASSMKRSARNFQLRYRNLAISSIPDRNFSLQQSCSANSKVAVSLKRQECKLEASYCKRVSHHKSNLPQVYCVKLIANYSKNRERRQISDSNPRQTIS
ncbi:hypothetical protein AVEN_253697-1 [Araneus ventricosus]|uniref:Uncharacterized protein n=1 Tax=Araneus ventricosus TaxID=182803 RepID=A0A4Y2DYK7_ARAVE|nr:hypothetical protein AVEN_253697-1 [Araneus ventricosus]